MVSSGLMGRFNQPAGIEDGTLWSQAWDQTRYLNVFTKSISNNLGYSTLAVNAGASTDGVTIRWDVFGSCATHGYYNQGATLTHEVGSSLSRYLRTPTASQSQPTPSCLTSPHAIPRHPVPWHTLTCSPHTRTPGRSFSRVGAHVPECVLAMRRQYSSRLPHDGRSDLRHQPAAISNLQLSRCKLVRILR